jgi:YD repeat-containing protein
VLCGLAIVAAVCAGGAQAATVQYVYDELGRLVAEVDAAGEVTVYTYDAAGNLVSVSRDATAQIGLIAFSPSRAKVGDEVTLYGFGFIPNPTQNAVSFNGTPASVVSATPNNIVALVPAGVSNGPITVANTNGSAITAQSFTLATPPVISAVTPGQVSRGATTSVDIAGTHLEGTRAVSFEQAGFAATVVPGATDTLVSIRLTVAGSVPLGTYEFSVTNDAGTTLSGTVTIGVSTALLGDVTAVTRPYSVHLPSAAAGAVPGNVIRPSRPFSVHLPADFPGALPGNTLNMSQPFSVHLPAVVQGVLPGNAINVSQPVSVSMP